MSASTFKERIGCWLHERWRTELALLPSADSGRWLDLCNRSESLTPDRVSGGRICEWRDSSELTVSRIFPTTGGRLLRHCLRQWPVRLNWRDDASATANAVDSPDASVLIAIGGSDRLAQFGVVLASLRGQTHEAVEILVVEQSAAPSLESMLPADVRYFHTEASPEGFNKSWALNVAAREARGRFLVVHDADYVVPADYVAECCRVLEEADAVRPARLLFHLDEASTQETVATRSIPSRATVQKIIQNNPTPLALRAEVYRQIGAHDERFVGWGGEDVEFLDRLRTREVAEGGWLPAIHLWHAAAPKKASGDRNQALHDQLLATDREQRIADLASVPWGRVEGAVAGLAKEVPLS